MTIYEAIRLYSPVLARNHNGQCLSTAQIWGLTHILQLVICYFVIKINVESLTINYYYNSILHSYRFKSIEKTSTDNSVVLVKSKTKVAPTSNDLSSSPSTTLANDPYSHIASIKQLEHCVSFKDRCLPILNLLKILHNLITYGHDFMVSSTNLSLFFYYTYLLVYDYSFILYLLQIFPEN